MAAHLSMETGKVIFFYRLTYFKENQIVIFNAVKLHVLAYLRLLVTDVASSEWVFRYESPVRETIVSHVGAQVAWGPCIIDTPDTAVAAPLLLISCKYSQCRFIHWALGTSALGLGGTQKVPDKRDLTGFSVGRSMSTKLAWELYIGSFLRQTDHLTGTSAHVSQGPRSNIPSWAQ
ncbi:hypothetical protein TNCV_2282411 [Trichonephila clavipes]|nr:hypothetical protein TNCV_2282411 [Trichonephila clavipes]